MNGSPRQLILASASPRRQTLLNQIGVNFTVAAQDIDESPHAGETAEALVVRLAEEKAQSALDRLADGHSPAPGANDNQVGNPRKNTKHPVVLGADTLVVMAGHILGKPQSEAEACAMLALLSEREHRVLTAVCVADQVHKQTKVSETQVSFRAISPAEASAYWHTGEPQGKAGGYGIQGRGAVFVQSLSGSYSTVMGLPLFETAQLLNQFDIPCWNSPALAGSRGH